MFDTIFTSLNQPIVRIPCTVENVCQVLEGSDIKKTNDGIVVDGDPTAVVRKIKGRIRTDNGIKFLMTGDKNLLIRLD